MQSETSQSPKGNVAVIGAGPAGLSCALELLKEGYTVDIFELDDKVGGLARTVEVLGQKADLGPHRFFSKLDEVNNFWLQGAAADDFITEQRLTRILYNGKFFDYPLKGFDALFKLGFLESTSFLRLIPSACGESSAVSSATSLPSNALRAST